MNRVELFIPCFINQFLPEVGLSMVKVLEKLDCKLHFNPDQTCCGKFAYEAGYQQKAEAIAQKFLLDFANTEGYIVAPSAACISMLRNHYGNILPENQQNKVFDIQKRSFEFTEFLTDILEVEEMEGAHLVGKAAYIDTCNALYACGIQESPRNLLYQVEDLELYELAHAETCCGFGGNFSAHFEHISTRLAEQKISEAEALELDYLITTDASCLLHLETYIKQKRKSLKVKHIAEVLASGW